MNQNEQVVLECEDKQYTLAYYHIPPQDQNPEYIYLTLTSGNDQFAGYVTIEYIQEHFNSLNDFVEQLQTEIQNGKLNFYLSNEKDPAYQLKLLFNYQADFRAGKYDIHINIKIPLGQVQKTDEQKIQEYYQSLGQQQISLDQIDQVLVQQQQQHQHLLQTAQNYLSNERNQQLIDSCDQKLRNIQNQLHTVQDNINYAQPKIQELESMYLGSISIENVLKVYQNSLFPQEDKVQLKINQGFAISDKLLSQKKFKFQIEDSDANITFGVVPGNENYETVNQIQNNNQSQYFFIPTGHYQHGQQMYENTLKHVFGHYDTVEIIVNPQTKQISVKVNDVLLTNIRNRNMAQSYKFFISVKDQQNLEGIIL